MRPGSKRDNARPSTPLGVRISSSGRSTILAWEPSIDNKRVVAYDVRFASHRARVVAPEVRVNGGTCGRIANVRVVAIDRAGNRSRPATATVRVGGCAQAAPGWFGGFETGDISEWDYLHAAAPERFQVVRSDQGVTPRQGNHMARVEVRGGEPASWDASMNASLAQKDNLPNVGLGNDVYMGWSVYIPRNFRYVPNGGSNLIMEWHADASMRQAPFHFGINGYNGRFFVDLHTAATGFSPVLSQGRRSIGDRSLGRLRGADEVGAGRVRRLGVLDGRREESVVDWADMGHTTGRLPGWLATTVRTTTSRQCSTSTPLRSERRTRR